MLDLRRRPRVPVPLLTPRLSSLWIGLVTPVDVGVARPLVEGLAVPTAVTDPSGAELFDDVHPIGFDEALRRAVAEDAELRRRREGLSGTPAAAFPRLSTPPLVGSAATVAAGPLDPIAILLAWDRDPRWPRRLRKPS